MSVLALLLNGPLLAGLFLYFLKKIRGETTTVETAFAGFFSKRFLHLFLAHFVMFALIGLGLVCLVLPGIYLMVAWSFTLALIIDKGLDFWPAMELSRKMVNRHWWKILFFLLVLAGVLLVGFLCCGIGVFVAAPIAIAAFMYGYEDIFGSWAPANFMAGQPTPATPAAYGPAGTMVVPNAVGTPPPAGGKAPPMAGAIPAAAIPPGNDSRQWLKYGLIGAVGLAVLIAVIALLPSFKLKMANVNMAHDFGEANIHEDESPNVMPPAEPDPPENITSPAYVALVERVRQELEKISIQFDELHLASNSDSNLVVSFDGLQKQSPAETNTAASDGIQFSNEHAKVSISLGNGIQVTDKKNHDHVSISLPVLQINVNQDQPGSGEDMDGTLVGTRLDGSNWQFAGTGKLAAVQFAMTNLDPGEILTAVEPPVPPEAPVVAKSSHKKLADRLAATETITDESIKDKSLTTLAEDAAKAGEVKIVKSALDGMMDGGRRDTATSASALLLAKAGFLKPAIELARVIADDDLRDKTLAELAQ